LAQVVEAPAVEPTTLSMTPAAVRARALRAERAAARETAKTLTRIPLAERKESDKIVKKMLREQKKFNEKIAQQRAAAEKKASRGSSMGMVHSNHAGPMFMRDAPAGTGKIVSGGYNSEKIDIVTAAHDAAEDGSRRVTPEGGGQHVGGHHEDTSEQVSAISLNYSTDSNDPAREYNSPVPRSSVRFKVKLDGDDSTRQLLAYLCGEFEEGELRNSQVFEIVPDSDVFHCRLCGFQTDWWSEARRHFENSVEDEGVTYNVAAKKAKELKSALAGMPPMTDAGPVAKPAPGNHAKAFGQAKAARRKHAREVAKAIKASKNGSSS
jgi:hypothetical protein